MDITTLAAWGEFLGGIGVIASLIYLASQIRQNSKLLTASAATTTERWGVTRFDLLLRLLRLREGWRTIAGALVIAATLQGCWWVPSVPVTPQTELDGESAGRKLSIEVEVIPSRQFADATYERIGRASKGGRMPSDDVTVKHGESGLRLLLRSLPAVFAAVTCRGAAYDGLVPQARIGRFPKLTLVPSVASVQARQTPGESVSHASIEYEFEFLREQNGVLQSLEVLRASGSGSYESTLGETLALVLGMLIPVPWTQPGDFQARWLGKAMAEAQELAIDSLLAQILESESLQRWAESAGDLPDE